MSKIIVVDTRRSFTSEIDLQLIMGDHGYEAKTLNTLGGIDDVISKFGATKMILAQNILKNGNVEKDYGIPVSCYLENEEGSELAEQYGFPCYGIIKEAEDLVTLIDKDPSKIQTKKPVRREIAEVKPHTAQQMGNNCKALQRTGKRPVSVSPSAERREAVKPKQKIQIPANTYKEEMAEMDIFESEYDDFGYSAGQKSDDFEELSEELDDEETFHQSDNYEEADEYEELEGIKELYEDEQEEELTGDKCKEPVASIPVKLSPRKNLQKKTALSPKVQKKRPKEPALKALHVYGEPDLDEQLQKDAGRMKPETKVVTVYSAKGGVGKTTIATEAAVYLALVKRGRRKLRVCLVDYNIDFGDVSTTLALNKKDPNLAYWADEIRELIKKGRKAEDINYSRKEIEEWLSVDEKSGLYVLQAPVTNEDSAEIRDVDLDVIMDNLKKNGEFDYIVCDTGNNTRNSTMSALEFADMIIMIIDQNVNTASCDERFIETMKLLDFDLDKMRMVINRVMPKKATTISVQELEEFLPFKCIGKLKFSTDVIKATNQGVPLAYSPDHEFTKQMREVIAYILDDNSFNVEDSKKKSFFEKLFGKKKRGEEA